MYRKQNTVVVALYLFLLCQMGFSLLSPSGEVKGALFSTLAYTVSMLVPSIFLAKGEGVRLNDSKVFPPSPLLCIAFTVAVIYVGNVLSFALSEVFHSFGYGINASVPVYESTCARIISFLRLVILPALLEEILMRGFVLRSIMPYGKGAAVLFSALIFGAFHMNLMQIPFAFLCGGVFGYFTVKTGSVTFAVFMHFLNNLSAFLLTYFAVDAPLSFYLAAGLIIVPCGVASGVALYKKGFFRERPVRFGLSPLVLVYIVFCIAFAISAIQPL